MFYSATVVICVWANKLIHKYFSLYNISSYYRNFAKARFLEKFTYLLKEIVKLTFICQCTQDTHCVFSVKFNCLNNYSFIKAIPPLRDLGLLFFYAYSRTIFLRLTPLTHTLVYSTLLESLFFCKEM